jgi:hypothetical protein
MSNKISTFTPVPNQDVFLENGQQAQYQGTVTNKLCVKLYKQDSDTNELWLSDKITLVDMVFEHEPYELYGELTTKSQERLKALDDERIKLSKEIIELTNTKNELTKAIAKFPDLALAIDFLEGRINYLVVSTFSRVELVETKEFLEYKENENYYQNIGIRLLCLFGISSDRKTHWMTNEYPDGSGHWTTVIPFETKEEAENFIKEEFVKECKLWLKDNDHQHITKFKSCQVFLTYPQEYLEAIKRNEIEYIAKKVSAKEKELVELRDSLEEAKNK